MTLDVAVLGGAGVVVKVDATAGVAEWEPGMTASELIAHADEAVPEAAADEVVPRTGS